MTRPRPWPQFPSLILLSLAFFSAALYLILIQGAKTSITEQLLVRETTVARAAASNTEAFFRAIGNATALRAQLSSFERYDRETQEDMDAFVYQWRDGGLVAGIILTDNQGVVKFNANTRGTQDVGASVADRDYFAWAQSQVEEGSYYIGAPVISKLGASVGQIIVPVASPVFDNDVFLGVTATSVKLEPLLERFAGNMRISDQTNVYLIDQHKNVLYSTTGSNSINDNLKSSISLGKEDQIYKYGRLIAYSPIYLGEQKWSIIIVSPIQEVLSLGVPFYIRQIGVLVLAATTTFIFGLVVSKKKAQNKLSG